MLPATAQIDSVSNIESFTVSSGELTVTDPCYQDMPWCSGILTPARNGTWFAQVGYHRDALDLESLEKHMNGIKESIAEARASGSSALEGEFVALLARVEDSLRKYRGRVAYIRAWHADAKEPRPADYTRAPFTVGVDSGQAGFFDRARFEATWGDDFDEFYDGVCKTTLTDTAFGAIDFGAASSSGWGDGGYEAYAKRDRAGVTEAAVIIFLGDG